MSKSRCDLDLDRTMPNVELIRAILVYVQVSSALNHYFFSYRVHRQTDTQTHRHTDGDESSIVAVDNYYNNNKACRK